jgi:hypothetical protein
MKKVGINTGEIDKMMKESFKNVTVNNKTVEENTMLQKNRHDKKKGGLVYFPSVMINNMLYRGNYDAHDIF